MENSVFLIPVTTPEDIKELVPDYLNNILGEMEKIKLAIEQNDSNSIGKITHKIRGTAKSYGFESIHKATERLQDSADQGNFEQTLSWALEIINYIQKTQS